MSMCKGDDVERFSEAVKKELSEMAMLGIRVPESAIRRAGDLEDMADLINMRVSECADLMLSLEDANGGGA